MSKVARAERSARSDKRADGEPAPKRRWRLSFLSVLVALLMLVGMSAALYPSTAAWWSSYNQSKLIRDYSGAVKEELPPGNDVVLAQANEYNALLASGALLGANERVPTSDSAAPDTDLDYWRLLSATQSGVMGRLKIPAINVDLPIYHGTSDETLAKGVGHLQGTSLPVGGDGTRTVLTAHSGLASATMFNNLHDLKVGDTFTIEVFGEVLTYQVRDTQVVLPDDTKSVLAVDGEDLATLVTCTPLGINTHRILVTGERITPTPIADIQAMGKPPQIPGFPWWAVIAAGGVLLVAAYIWWSGYPPKKRRKRQPDPSTDSETGDAGEVAEAGEAPVSDPSSLASQDTAVAGNQDFAWQEQYLNGRTHGDVLVELGYAPAAAPAVAPAAVAPPAAAPPVAAPPAAALAVAAGSASLADAPPLPASGGQPLARFETAPFPPPPPPPV